MKNRIISILMVICLLVCLFPASAFAEEVPLEPESTSAEAVSPYFSSYSAIGDSICAGFSQPDYVYQSGLDMNIETSPKLCYANLVGETTGSKVFNLGKLGCDTDELINILTDESNTFHNTYLDYLKTSDLITVEIGANDLAMTALSSVLKCLGPEYENIEPMKAFELLVPFVKTNPEGMKESIKTVLGIDLTPEQFKALMLVNSDAELSATLEEGYQIFAENYPIVMGEIQRVLSENNPDAKLVVLNYYNPYYGFDEALGQSIYYKYDWVDPDSGDLYTFNIGEVVQVPTVKMNELSRSYCESNNLPYVDISDVNISHLLTNGIDPHPNFAGHALIAAKIVDALNTVTATALMGGTITPNGKNVVKSGLSMTFTIAAESGFEICDVKVDGESKGAIKEYTFENINEDHCITATFKNGEETKPTDGTMYYETYTALGDSITAGYTFGSNYAPDKCYATVTAQKLGVKNYYNLGIPAYKTEDLLKALSDPSDVNHDRFVSDIKTSDLVSVYIGSNDLTMVLLDMVFEYLGKDLDNMTPEQRLAEITSVMKLLQNGVKPETLEDDLKKLEAKLTQDQITQIVGTIKARYDQAYAEFTVNWDAIITAIRKINPDVAIVSLGYYNPVQKIDTKGIEDKIGEANKKYLDSINALGALSQGYVDSMNNYISKVSTVSNQYLYVETAGVELITAGPIVVDPHPSARGHEQIAEGIEDAVLNDITAVGGSGVTVSPDGKKTVAYGLTDDYTYTYKFTPTSGNVIKEVFVDGNKVDAPDGAYTFKEVSGDHTISITSMAIPYVPPTINYYTVTTNASKGGTITSSATGSVMEGTNVTITITPDADYSIDYIELDGNRISNTSIITISNISANHSVYIAFKDSKGESNSKNPFIDVKSTDWFYEEVMYMYGNKIMRGTSDTTFEPNVAVSRAMIVAILYRMDNEPAVTYKNDFTDVAKDKWYTNAVLWAAEKGILKGYGDGKLGPEDEVTREQIVNILYQYAVYKGYNTTLTANLSGYTDTASVSEWASAAMQWAVKEGLINGKNNQLDPGSSATRAEIAAIIYRFLEKY